MSLKRATKATLSKTAAEHDIYQLLKDREEGGYGQRSVLDVPEAPKGYIDANGGRNLDKGTDVAYGYF
jgi:hypothetical protein